MPEDKSVLLLRYSFTLQPDGRLRTDVEHVNPEEFLKAATEANKEWAEAPIVSKAITYLLSQLAVVDTDLEKYLLSL